MIGTNNAVGAMVADLIVAVINRWYRTYKHDDQLTLIRRRDIVHMPRPQEEVLRDMIRFKGDSNGQWTEQDWRDFQGTYAGGHRSIIRRLATPLGQLEHTLGQFSWKVNEDGDTIVSDVYDWNAGRATLGQGFYTAVRVFMGKYGSRDTDPDAGKRHYKVNLGKV